MPLQTTQAALNANSPQAPGNVLNTAAKIRTEASMREWGTQTAGDVAEALHGLQDQIYKLNRLIAQVPPPLQTFSVVDSIGSLIGWIGDQVTATAEFIGAWFKTLYIGGTGPADAKIVADASGNVTINGATITLTENGVMTVIDGSVNSLTGHPQGLLVRDIVAASHPYASIGPDDIILTREFASVPTLVAELHQNLDGGLLHLFNGTHPDRQIILDNTTPVQPIIKIQSGGSGAQAAMNPIAVGVTDGVDSSAMSATAISSGGTIDSAADITSGGNVFGGGTDMAALLADIGTINTTLTSLQLQITSLNSGKADHGGALTGTADLVTGAVTGTIT